MGFQSNGRISGVKSKVMDKTTCSKKKWLGRIAAFSENEKHQLLRFSNACKRIPQVLMGTSQTTKKLFRNCDISVVHEIIIKNDSEIVKSKGERRSLALQAIKVESSDDERSTGSGDEEYAMAVRDFKKFFKRRGRFVRQQRNDKKTECRKPLKEKNQRAFVEGCWSDSGEEDDEKDKDNTCLMA
nr:hypothetical protein [Tanacetum cinerariifolium]